MKLTFLRGENVLIKEKYIPENTIAFKALDYQILLKTKREEVWKWKEQ